MISLPDAEDFILDDYPLYNLNRTSATYTDVLDKALAEVGVSQALWRVLAIVNDQNPSTVSDIARRSVIKISTLTRMLDRMQKDGYIKRNVNVNDRRIVHVEITVKGRKALKTALQITARVYARAFTDISEKDALHLMNTLKKVRNNLSRSPYVE